ncbi:DUF4864 domain-containing protein [Alphaproteobacteria bacterium KMM 3653]|uniref:DUF4864 domain-containing protein n=1 Tax=Harenicola maris TaxID=2841044 RepID=A0AAP2CLV3_9RHOB|nr:DUF4864 domain-containing protein [Harenicola maris]
MRFLVLAAGLMALPAAAQDAPGAALRGVISDQIDAIGVDDYARAFTFASPFIQGLFRTPENFGAMVERGYPMVAAPRSVDFGETRAEGPLFFQDVIFEDAQGRFFTLEYEMIRGPDGFVINGVTLKQPPEVGV